ncbi:transcriptional regulator [Salmonella enterica]|nr:transcriptional regulator [Salmonella enterica]EGK9673223.1 transcriptional regulator [Salmonella enterica]
MSVNKRTLNKDWHRADIVAELHKRRVSLAELGRTNQLSASTLKNALDKRYPKAEKIIADALGLAPQEIWPSRY